MISNERTTTYGHRSHAGGHRKPPAEEDTLKTEKIQIERKTFVFALRENSRGRFLRITEDSGGRRETIIVPAPGLQEFRDLCDAMIHAAAEIPPKAETASA